MKKRESAVYLPYLKQLYAYYKQVSQGDIDTQRPGIFDVVGRAKWYNSIFV